MDTKDLELKESISELKAQRTVFLDSLIEVRQISGKIQRVTHAVQRMPELDRAAEEIQSNVDSLNAKIKRLETVGR